MVLVNTASGFERQVRRRPDAALEKTVPSLQTAHTAYALVPIQSKYFTKNMECLAFTPCSTVGSALCYNSIGLKLRSSLCRSCSPRLLIIVAQSYCQ